MKDLRVIAVIYATFAVAKRKPEKNSGLMYGSNP